jgi:hypothetical protein
MKIQLISASLILAAVTGSQALEIIPGPDRGGIQINGKINQADDAGNRTNAFEMNTEHADTRIGIKGKVTANESLNTFEVEWQINLDFKPGSEENGAVTGGNGAGGGASTVNYREHIQPLLATRCGLCHGANAAPTIHAFDENPNAWLAQGKGMRMDTYSHLVAYIVWPDTGALMRRLDDGKNTSDGKAGNMYIYLGTTEQERQHNLQLMKNWVGNWNLKRWNEISKEEIDSLYLKY